MEYVIEEIIDIVCDVDKILSVKFRLESDPINRHREIVDSDYYEWCYELYVSENEGSNYTDIYDESETFLYDEEFNVDFWDTYYSNEESVIDFIYETYGYNELPPSID